MFWIPLEKLTERHNVITEKEDAQHTQCGSEVTDIVIIGILLALSERKHGLTFTWWDVVVYVFNINQPNLPTPFYSVLVSISVSWSFQLYFIA